VCITSTTTSYGARNTGDPFSWLFEKFPELKKKLWKGHLWNPSYYVGTCGDVTKETIRMYIERQKVK